MSTLEELIEVSGQDTDKLQAEYERYVKDCVKKNREPFDPEQWAKSKLDERNSTETRHVEQVKIQFRMLLEQSGFKYPMDTLALGRHRGLLGKPEEQKGICPLCQDTLCKWSNIGEVTK